MNTIMKIGLGMVAFPFVCGLLYTIWMIVINIREFIEHGDSVLAYWVIMLVVTFVGLALLLCGGVMK